MDHRPGMNRTVYVLITVALLIGAIGGAACEPFAPEVTQQVIVITPTANLTQTADFAQNNFVPASPTASPTLRPSLTPTEVIIPTGTVPPCDVSVGGRLFESTLTSDISAEPIPYHVYVPPCFFESGRRYPLLILLHGGTPYDYNHWLDIGLVDALNTGILDGNLPPMLAVLPQGGTYLTEQRYDVGDSLEDIILLELIPDLQATYCIQQPLGIGGIGRGAFWALSIALRHPDRFGAVGAHSPILLPDNAPRTHNPLSLAERANAVPTLSLYLDNAQNDPNGANLIVFSNALRAQNIPHEYVINTSGGQDNDYWRTHLNEYLAFYATAYPDRVELYPSCQE